MSTAGFLAPGKCGLAHGMCLMSISWKDEYM